MSTRGRAGGRTLNESSTERRETSGATGLRKRNVPSEATRQMRRRGTRLEWATFIWNVIELVVAVTAGLVARSLALVAFGLDSGVEVFGSVVVLWHLAAAEDGQRELRSTRLIAWSFGVLGVYLALLTLHKTVTGGDTDASPIGIAFMAVTVVVMFGLAVAKHRTATQLRSSPLHANAHMTAVDGILAVSVTVALLTRVLLEWQFVDALAAAVVAVVALNEAREGLAGRRSA